MFGPRSSGQLIEKIGVSQPTMSRALGRMAKEIVRIGSGSLIQYALRDMARGMEDVPVYRVTEAGRLQCLGSLIAVDPGPTAMVFRSSDGKASFFEDLPWWADDMRPQGFLGRAFAARHGQARGLPDDPRMWSGTQTLRALVIHGHDGVGNLLFGERNRTHFLTMPNPVPLSFREFPRLAAGASAGDDPGSSAGGEQPKFLAYAETSEGPKHTIVKFAGSGNEVQRRWRDLLATEHLALETLRAHGETASMSWLADEADQRFLVSERFDRVGATGRRALVSLSTLNCEFVANSARTWPEIARCLFDEGLVVEASLPRIETLWAFGALIGNTDMHLGNLAFFSGEGPPYQVAPAYDLLPMIFAPSRDGVLRFEMRPVRLDSSLAPESLRRAHAMAIDYVGRLRHEKRISKAFFPCIDALEQQLQIVDKMLARLA